MAIVMVRGKAVASRGRNAKLYRLEDGGWRCIALVEPDDVGKDRHGTGLVEKRWDFNAPSAPLAVATFERWADEL